MTIQEALRQLADGIKAILHERIRQYGVNDRTGTNTLEGSELERSIRIEPTENGVILYINDYWQFVARGWKRTGNYPNTFPQMIENLTDWVRRKGITFEGMSQNSVVWAIANSIFERGIRPRPFMVWSESGDLAEMIPELDKIVDEWMDVFFNTIMEKINLHFK